MSFSQFVPRSLGSFAREAEKEFSNNALLQQQARAAEIQNIFAQPMAQEALEQAQLLTQKTKKMNPLDIEKARLGNQYDEKKVQNYLRDLNSQINARDAQAAQAKATTRFMPQKYNIEQGNLNL